MSARWALGLALGALLAGCESGVNRELLEKPYPYSCDRGTADAGCSHGWRCGLDGRCFNPALIEPRRCERALDRGTDGGFDCSGGWRCGLDGLCFDPAPDAGLPRACNHGEERDAGAYDCAEGWRCGLDDRCFPLVVNDDAGVSSAVARACDRAQEERGQGLDCPLGWRCGIDERCFHEAQAAQRSCDRPFERRHDGGFDCTQGWRCGLDNRCFDPSPDAGAPRPCDRAGELGGDGYDCAEGWHCSVTNACFRPTGDPLRACDRALERARDGGYDCAPDWRCGLDQHCFDPASGAARACDRAEQLDAGAAYDCAAGWRCGPEGTCFEVAQAGARGCDPSLGNADCRGGWRCGYTGVCHDQDAGEPYPCRDDGDCEQGWRCDRVARACALVTDRVTSLAATPTTRLVSPLASWPRPRLYAISDELVLVESDGGVLTTPGPGQGPGSQSAARLHVFVFDGGVQAVVHSQNLFQGPHGRQVTVSGACDTGGQTLLSVATWGARAVGVLPDGGLRAWAVSGAWLPDGGFTSACVPAPVPPGADTVAFTRVATGVPDGGPGVGFGAGGAGGEPSLYSQAPWRLDAGSDYEIIDVAEQTLAPYSSTASADLVVLTTKGLAVTDLAGNGLPAGPWTLPGTLPPAATLSLVGVVDGGVPARLLVSPSLPASPPPQPGVDQGLAVVWNDSASQAPVAVTMAVRRSSTMATSTLEYRGTCGLCPGTTRALAVAAGPVSSTWANQQSVLVRCSAGADPSNGLSVPERAWVVYCQQWFGGPLTPKLATWDEDRAPFREPWVAQSNHPVVRAFAGRRGQAWWQTEGEVLAMNAATRPHRVLLDREPEIIFRDTSSGNVMGFENQYQLESGPLGLASRYVPEQTSLGSVNMEFLAIARNPPFLALTRNVVIGSGRALGVEGPQVVAWGPGGGATTFQKPATVQVVSGPDGGSHLVVSSYDGIYQVRVDDQMANPNTLPTTFPLGFTPVAGSPIQSLAVGTVSPGDGGAPELRGYAVTRGELYTFVLGQATWQAQRVPTDFGAGTPIDVLRIDSDAGVRFRVGYDTGVLASAPAVAPLSAPVGGGQPVLAYAQLCGDTWALSASGLWRATNPTGGLATWTAVPLPAGLAPPTTLFPGPGSFFVATALGEVVEVSYGTGTGGLPRCP